MSAWYTGSNTFDNCCSLDLEYLVVKCKPFYLPRQFTPVFILAVYIPPDANAAVALDSLVKAIDKIQRAQPDGLLVTAGDFNHAKFVRCATRGGNTLDMFFLISRKVIELLPYRILAHLTISLSFLFHYTSPLGEEGHQRLRRQ